MGEDPEFQAMYEPLWVELAGPDGPPSEGLYLRRDLLEAQ